MFSTNKLYILMYGFLLCIFNALYVNCVFTISADESSTSEFLTANLSIPIVINTWPFVEAANQAWNVLERGDSALDAIEIGCTKCETLQCDGTVGYGGSPDENGETTLDAMIMDGETHDVGAVGALRRVKSAISVARHVMERTDHTLLVGSQATEFALMMGFKEQNLSTNQSSSMFSQWVDKNCQPNFWRNVVPNPKKFCGPYSPKTNVDENDANNEKFIVDEFNHDTIGMIAIDSSGRIAGGTSTNGASHKIPGRVGDSPIPGSGAYVDKTVGGAAATGDGDVMMRFMPSLLAVEYMRLGVDPDKAANLALERIVSFYPKFSGAVISININGTYGAACHNLPEKIFRFSVGKLEFGGVKVLSVPCIVNPKILTIDS